MTEDIIITKKVSQNQLNQAVDIYYFAFQRKIRALIKGKEKAVAIYGQAINPDRGIFALSDDKVVGVIGLHYHNKNFMEIKYKNVREHFNPIQGYFIYFINKIMYPKIEQGVLRIDAIAVDEKLRGHGIGSLLIKKVFEFAKEKGFKEIILEVVDTNPRAKKLYEILGFKEKKIVNYFFTKRAAGFSSESVMSYNMENFF